MADAKPRDERMIAALLRERAGLVQVGKTDRVAEVDEQLRLHGHTDSDESEKDERAAQVRKAPPQGRTTKPQHTGD